MPLKIPPAASRGRANPRARCIATRLHAAAPNEGERFFLYLLLLEAAGATSFDDLRTVAAMVCGSFREADMARGLADDDREHHVALEDAASLRSAAALRALFVLLSLQTEVAEPPGP